MASSQSNPGFVTGQIPTAAQWNSYFTVKQDALIRTIYVSGDTTVLSSACKYVCDCSSGDIALTINPAFGQPGHENRVRVVMKSVTPAGHKVTFVGQTFMIINECDGGGAGWLDIDADGTTLSACGVP
jgi:hypothetical protein